MLKITSFANYTTAEGERLSYTYSKIDDSGNIIDSNIRETKVIPEGQIDVLEACKIVKDFIAKEYLSDK